MPLILALAAAASSESADAQMQRMAALYDQICLQTFQDNEKIVALKVTYKAREYSSDEVKVTMVDDPARGWQLENEGASVWIEFPPYHACSVRWNAPEIGSLQPYRDLANRYEHSRTGFQPVNPYEVDKGGIHIHAVGEQRTMPDRRTEALFFFDRHITDPTRRAAGATGFVLRFVHQIGPPAT
jgi:hypothetical protein